MARWAGLSLAAVLLVSAAGCKKKTPIPPPPNPIVQPAGPTGPASAGATITEFAVEPSTIERGQSANLRWTVTGANDIVIDNGIGTVPPTGTRSVQPADSTTYTLSANGVTRTARVVVTAPAPPPPPPPSNNSSKGTLESRVQAELRDALYDYDSNNIRDDARVALTADAEAMKRIFADFPNATIAVEGHCDERGSAEYNLGLGDRRATSARDFLIQLGVPADKLKPISYGKERPQCTEASEGCYQSNRRAHFAAAQ
ncbi:MAG: OmpA/MotB domain protein [Bryobacterales bacterium]|nr:OmpA/MotB domain protein [Bryobacterales bacterium]